MYVIIVEIVFLPVFIFVAILAGKRLKVARDKRLAAYRNSPASRILRLND
jgi:hypothetical protein